LPFVAAPAGVKTLLMLDEFKMLGYLSAVENALSLAADYNLQIWPFVAGARSKPSKWV